MNFYGCLRKSYYDITLCTFFQNWNIFLLICTIDNKITLKLTENRTWRFLFALHWRFKSKTSFFLFNLLWNQQREVISKEQKKESRLQKCSLFDRWKNCNPMCAVKFNFLKYCAVISNLLVIAFNLKVIMIFVWCIFLESFCSYFC